MSGRKTKRISLQPDDQPYRSSIKDPASLLVLAEIILDGRELKVMEDKPASSASIAPARPKFNLGADLAAAASAPRTRPAFNLGGALASAASSRKPAVDIDAKAASAKKEKADKAAALLAATNVVTKPSNAKAKTDDEWKACLPKNQYQILRKKATEPKDITVQKGEVRCFAAMKRFELRCCCTDAVVACVLTLLFISFPHLSSFSRWVG
jgi:hypothetical protein